jgi:hypothetical protein
MFSPFGIYAYGSLDEALCALAADAADETRIKNKIRAADAKTNEHNFLLMLIILPPNLSFIFHIKNVNILTFVLLLNLTFFNLSFSKIE